jgi:hypothetical protein
MGDGGEIVVLESIVTGTSGSSGSSGTSSAIGSYLTGLSDRSRRILGAGTSGSTIKILGETNGPFVITISNINYTISSDTEINIETSYDYDAYGNIYEGEDFYVYACLNGSNIEYKVSTDSETANTYTGPFSWNKTPRPSFRLGGFHTFCYGCEELYGWQASTGVWHGYWCVFGDAGTSLYKYRAQYQGVTGTAAPSWPVVGQSVTDAGTVWITADIGMSGKSTKDIIPNSIWDLTHRARCLDNTGMTYDPNTGLWIDIYLSESTGIATESRYAGTITTSRRWTSAVSDGHSVGKRLLTDSEFQSAADGSWDESQIYGGVPFGNMTGSHSCLFTLTLDGAPTPGDFVPGGAPVHGNTSTLQAQVLYKVSPTVYLCRNLSGTAGFTDGETLHDGTNTRAGTAGYPKTEVSNIGRIVSNIGCEDMVGVYDQWLLDQAFMIVGGDYSTAATFTLTDLEDQRGSVYMQSESKMVAGGHYTDANKAGTLSRKISIGRNTQSSLTAARYCCESL